MNIMNMAQSSAFRMDQAQGDQFTLARTHRLHFSASGQTGIQLSGGAENSGDFASLLMQGLQEVNGLQNDASQISLAAALNPDEVDAHDVTIAAAKAELALNLTKNIVDRVIQGYKDISNLR